MIRQILPIWTLCFLLLLPLYGQGQSHLSLPEAIAQELVSISARGSGGYQGKCLQLAIKNLTNRVLVMEVPPGYIFPSEDSSVQDLMVTAPAIVAVGKKQVKRTMLYTMCTQSGNMGPKAGDRFLAGEMGETNLVSLAEKIAKNQYQNSTAQSAVWAVANMDPIRNMYGEDTSMVRDLALSVSEATGTPMAEFILVPRRHQITSIRASVEGLIPNHLQAARLGLYDAEGNLVREYFERRKVEKGYMQWKVGASHTLGDSAELSLRLFDGDQLILEKSVAAGDSVLPLQRMHSEAVLIYEVEEDVRANVGVYDEAGQLYFFLDEDRFIPDGMHRSRYIAGKDLPADQPYFLQIRAGEALLASEPISFDGPEPKIFRFRTISGTAKFRLKAEIRQARLAIYDEQGRLKRIMYDVHRMSPGQKQFRYRFQHDQGPEARFFLRLTDADGTILVEQEIQ
ncbi:MAG: hypothetical protein AAF399_25915 [Bacteroidota bacterium]